MKSGVYYDNRYLDITSLFKDVIGGIAVLPVTCTTGGRPYSNVFQNEHLVSRPIVCAPSIPDAI